MKIFRNWARDKNLKPSYTAYHSHTRDRRKLRFSKSGDDSIERSYCTHYVSLALSEKKKQKIAEKEQAPELTCFIVTNESSK